MKYTDQLIRLTDKAAADFERALDGLPEDKLEWKVLDAGRTALDQYQEIAQSPTYVIPILKNKSMGDFNPESFQKIRQERADWTKADCKRILRENLDKFYEVVRNYPDEDLTVEIDLPFAEGMRQSMADIMAYPYWNLSYHLGQIAFIQTLYGDWQMR